jgi:hypothetical protein
MELTDATVKQKSFLKKKTPNVRESQSQLRPLQSSEGLSKIYRETQSQLRPLQSSKGLSKIYYSTLGRHRVN